ncbi:hypothetical protein BGZ70_006502 [Mortierella alpina]|uniref:F-box domain-containing protein n=1 Tax=Mortierella alpina TaxID=64518 RepID=A0A9P6JB62_MORAP|nr:hypothetical protein BGZ70_006502 [Mortierella alpina]
MESPISILDIPLIQDQIALNLATQDLVACALVCRAWSEAFNPILWNFIRIGSTIQQRRFIRVQESARYRSHARTLTTAYPLSSSLSPSCAVLPNLTRLKCRLNASCQQNEGIVETMFLFIQAHESLITVQLSSLTVDHTFPGIFERCVKDHPSLTSLDLSIRGFISVEDLSKVLNDCTRLERLRLRVATYLYYEDAWDIIPEKLMGDQRNCRLTDFAIDQEHRCVFDPVILQFLERCPLLRTLSLPLSKGESTLISLGPLISAHCPQLQHLQLGRATQTGLAAVLQACSAGLLALTMPVACLNAVPAILAHRRTLMKLDLLTGMGLQSASELFSITNSCPQLKDLALKVKFFDSSRDALGANEETLARLLSQDWVCTNLENLTLELQDCATERPRLPYIEYMYQQLGRLTRLKSLWMNFGKERGLLELSQGFRDHLQSLAGLKDLDRLRIDAVEQASVDELIWITTQWPNIKL